MYLITSGDYVNQALEAEFGTIPPTFLPLQNKRLFKHQIDKIPNGEIIYMSLPDTFELNEKDKRCLIENEINIVYVPSGLSLGQSIVQVLNSIGMYELELKIIHGDTLFENMDFDVNVYVVARTNDNYKWAYTGSNGLDNVVYAGFFSFSNQNLFIRLLTKCNYNFITAIKSYKNEIVVNELFIDKWFDFGHINTYYRSKSHLTTERSFNYLSISNQIVYKESSNINKILAEVNWFNSIPSSLKVFSPQVYNYGKRSGKGYYELEYFFLSTLSELFVFGLNQKFIWFKILESCQNFINICYSTKTKEKINLNTLDNLYGHKTSLRLIEFEEKTGFDIRKPIVLNNENYPSLLEVAEITSKLIRPARIEDVCITHGDFCFSNIMYNFRTQNVKVIDPRGLDANNNQLIYGDIRYDVAKLAHSVLGLYDLIMSEYYILEENEPYNYIFEIFINKIIKDIQERFITMRFGGRTLQELDTFPILVHLFLSMIPLHYDDNKRQKALLINALMLYKKIL